MQSTCQGERQDQTSSVKVIGFERMSKRDAIRNPRFGAVVGTSSGGCSKGFEDGAAKISEHDPRP